MVSLKVLGEKSGWRIGAVLIHTEHGRHSGEFAGLSSGSAGWAQEKLGDGFPAMTARASKSAWRQWAKDAMQQVAQDEIDRWSAKVVANLRSVPEFSAARHVLVCLSFDKEVNTWELVEELTTTPRRFVYVPRVDSAGEMHIHPFPCRLTTLSTGLKQPLAHEPEIAPDSAADVLDVAVIVGLAFERQRGYRLGRGGGHFDRFLKGKNIFAIGLSFERVITDHLPTEAHDVPMSVIVSEERVYRF